MDSGSISNVEVGKYPIDITVNPFLLNSAVYVANQDSDSVSVISGENITKIEDIAVGRGPIAMALAIRSSWSPETNDTIPIRLYVANSDSDSVSVISGMNNTKIKDIPVGNYPTAIAINSRQDTIYVANSGSDSISVISGMNNTKIGEDIPVGDRPKDIAINSESDKVYVLNTYSDSVSIISGKNNIKIKDIPVGKQLTAIAINEGTDTVYVADAGSNTVSVISGRNNTKIGEDIPVGDAPIDIAINSESDTVYVLNTYSDSVSIISGKNNTKIGEDIPVGHRPTDIGFNYETDTIYVVNEYSDSVSIISGKNNTKIGEDIPVGHRPTDIGFDEMKSTVYIAYKYSNTVSVIDSIVNKVVSGVTLKVFPLNSGYIECDGIISPLSQYFYLYSNSMCIAKPNKGFEFQSWEEKLKNDATQLINSAQNASTIFEDITNSFHNMVNYLGIDNFLGIQKSVEPEATLKITKFGTFTATFKELPVPLPPEYWGILFGVVITTLVSSWLTPTIVGWRKAKKHQDILNYYIQEIDNLYNDGNLDKNDIKDLDRLQNNIKSIYNKQKINKEQYEILKEDISILYNEIFQKQVDSLKKNDNKEKIKLLDVTESDLNNFYLMKKIDKENYNSLKNQISILYQEIFATKIAGINNVSINEDKIKLLNIVLSNIEEAYSKEKINEKHYNLLKEKISELKNKNNDNVNNK